MWSLHVWTLDSECLGLNSGSAICWLCDLNKFLSGPKRQHLKVKAKIVLLHEIITDNNTRVRP